MAYHFCHTHKCNNYCSWAYGSLLIRKGSFTYKISKNSTHLDCSYCHIPIINHLQLNLPKKKSLMFSFQLSQIIFVHLKTLRYTNLIDNKS